MRLTSWLTIATFVLLVWQFRAKKGNTWHILRWFLILGTSIAIVVINTSRLAPNEFENLLQDPFFATHVFLGFIYFVFLLALPLLGYLSKFYSDVRRWKKIFAYLTLIFWCLSMLAIIPLVFRYGM